jgi:hypothetical protein
MSNFSQAERIAKLEERVASMNKELESIDGKLDELLALRYKGVGAFWVASGLVGTGIIGFLMQLVSWFRGT